MSPLLELKNIVKTFERPSGPGEVTVLHDISLQVDAGESLSVLGPSGSGKSTLLNLIGTLDRPSSGIITFQGKNLADMRDDELSRVRNLEIGFVFQLHHLLPQCTVLENVLVPTIPLRVGRKDQGSMERAENLLDKVGLAEHRDHFPAQLSGGELQRVAVVRALINRPRLVLADEPTGSLDRETAAGLGRILVGLNRDEGVTLIVVTHSLELAGMMDKRYQLLDGKLERVGAGSSL